MDTVLVCLNTMCRLENFLSLIKHWPVDAGATSAMFSSVKRPRDPEDVIDIDENAVQKVINTWNNIGGLLVDT